MSTINQFLGFNPYESEAAESFEGRSEPIPEGEYTFIGKSAKKKNTKKKDGYFWLFTYVVYGGEYDGRTVEFMFNIENQNDMARKIGRSQMRRYLDVIGVLQPENEDAMLNIPFKATVKCKKESYVKDGKTVEFIKNEITRMDAVSDKTGVPASSATTQPTQADSKDDTPPWEKQGA